MPPGSSNQKLMFAALGVLALLGTGALAAFALWPAHEVEPAVAVVLPTPVPVDAGPPVLAIVAEPEPDPEPLRELPVVKEEPAKTPGKRAPKGKGQLSLQTVPWTNVMFGKKNLGETPLVGVTFPVGKHRLVLVNDERKLRTTIEVDIKPNKTTTLKLKL